MMMVLMVFVVNDGIDVVFSNVSVRVFCFVIFLIMLFFF